MSLLLRSSKRFVSLGWQSHKICRKCPVRFSNSLSLNEVLPLSQQNTRSFRTSFHLLNQRAQVNSAFNYNDEEPRAISFDEKIFKMDTAIKKQGRITVQQVQSIIADIRRLGTVTSNQSLLLVRCCGSLLPEFPAEKRTILVDEIWRLITELRCPLDVSHYNTLLNVYIENEHKFDPSEFLLRMEANNIIPNRVTYQRLIQRCCQDGDIEGASKLFEVLKTEGYPVNEAVFHNLILGHSKANNMDDAKKIFDVMRNSQLNPAAGAYCALASGYALHGDMHSVLSTLEEAEASNAALSDRDLLSVIHTLAVNNFGDSIHQILPKLKKTLGFNNDCLNLILELVNNGQHRIGFALLSSMSARNLADGSAAPSGEFFIRQIIKMNVPPEIVLDYCNKLKEEGLNDTALLRATRLVLLLEKPDYAICFLKGLHAQKHSIRPHFFWPILIRKKNENETEIYSVLKLMLELECPADIDTLKDYVFPHLNFDDPFSILNRLRDDGQDVQLLVNSLVLYLLQSLNDVESSLKLLEKYPGSVNRNVLDRISTTLAKTNVPKRNANLATVLNVLKYANVNQLSSAEPTRYQNPVDIHGHFLIEYLKNENVGDMKNILLAMKEKNCTITKSSGNSILAMLGGHRNVDIKDLQGLVQSLISDEDLGDTIANTPESGPKEVKTSLGELEATLELTPESEGRCEVLKQILILCCKERDISKAESVLEQLKQYNFQLTAGLLSTLLNMYSFEYHLDKSCHYYKLLESEFPTFIMETYQLMNMATVYAKEKKIDEMDKFLSQVSSRTNPSRMNLEMNVRRLLKALSEAGLPEKTQQVFGLCIRLKLCNPTPRVIAHLILSHLAKNDVNGAIEELKRISNLYGCAPATQQICKRLIEQENTDQLQEVMELSSKHYGEVNSMLDLACSFLELGRIKQAKMILSTPGLQARSEKMDFLCESFVKANKIDCLENFIELTKDLFDVDRDKMFQHLIKGYVKTENADKALGIWVQMQEENVQPSDHTLHLLGTFLKRMNRIPPFSYSEEPLESVAVGNRTRSGQVNQTRNNQNSNSDPTFLQKLLESGDLNDAVEHVLKYNNEDMRKNHKDVISLATRLSELGNVTAIQQIQDTISPFVSLYLTDQLGNAYLNSGRGKEFLQSLETDADKYKKYFPDLAIFSLFDAYPKDIDKIARVLKEKYTDHTDRIENIVWAHHVKVKNFDEADSIFQSSPELQRHIIMKPLLEYCKKSNDEEVSKKMFEVVKSSEMSNRAKGRAASTHVNVLVSSKKLDKAVDFVLSELSSMEQKYLNHETLTRLDSILTSAGKTLPAMANLIRNANFDWKKV